MKPLIILAVLGMTGCAQQFKAERPVAQAANPLQPEVITKVVEKKVPVAVAHQLKAMETLEESKAAKNTGSILEAGNEKSRQRPEDGRFFNSITVYDYMDGALYQVYAAPLKMTHIMLQPGEKITGQVLVGDSVSWKSAVVSSGEGNNARQSVYIKPIMSGRKTNMSIPTNKRVYTLELTSFKQSYMSQVMWNYHSDTLVDVESNKNNSTQITQISPEQLNFNYQVKKKKGKPVWMPLSVFDDGSKTYIKFDPRVNSDELPVLFLVTKESNTQIVNYRYQDHVMVVDRLFNVAEIRQGKNASQAVSIVRKG